MDRISASRRPTTHPAGFHTWSELLFIHWRVDPSLLRPLIPKELSIDTCDGSAWLGLVPFYMSDVRPWWSPPVWGISTFPETNVRTYVHYQGEQPGVWFFSLDAAKLLAVVLARWGWGLNYHWSTMRVERHNETVSYRSFRRDRQVQLKVEARIGGPDPDGVESTEFPGVRNARPGSLEHFLVERYLLYTVHRGVIYSGQVHHHPYPLHNAELIRLEQSLVGANGIEINSPPCHVRFAPSVQVEVYPLRMVCQTTDHSAAQHSDIRSDPIQNRAI